MSTVVVVDYGMGNLRSVWQGHRACRRWPKSRLVPIRPSRAAERVVVPRPGRDARLHARARGARPARRRCSPPPNKPFLGICIGLQMLFEHSEEGDVPGLEILPAASAVFRRADGRARRSRLKVPHMGWNQVQQAEAHPLWEGIADGARFYFVHSYYVEPDRPGCVVGSTDYGIPFTSAVARDNIFAIQFHPEKSAQAGLAMLANFVAWKP
jgi:glutamine amidotransferase